MFSKATAYTGTIASLLMLVPPSAITIAYCNLVGFSFQKLVKSLLIYTLSKYKITKATHARRAVALVTDILVII